MVLLEEERVVLDSDSRITRSRRLVYRIGTGGPEGWSTVEAAWRPQRQERPVIRARVVTTGGRELRLDETTISEASLGPPGGVTFSDSRVLRAPLPALTPGAVVETEITQRDIEPAFGQGVTSMFAVGQTVPVLRTVYSVEAPTSLPVQFVSRLLPEVQPGRAASSERTTVTFDIGRQEPWAPANPFAPAEAPPVPYIAFSTGQSWTQVAMGYGRLVDERIAQSDLSEVVGDMLQGATAREAIVERLLGEVQKRIRYTAVLLGDGAIVPSPPGETLERGYGDCKDQATLLIAMLRTAGIDAHIALLKTGPGLEVESSLPGLGGFDHAVVYVPGEDPLWIDPTAGFSRPGQIPFQDQGRLALIAMPDTTELVRLPEATASTVETRDVYVAEEGFGRVVETTEVFGSDEIGYRSTYATYDENEVRQMFEAYAEATYGAGGIRNVEYADSLEFSAPFRMSFEAVDAELVETVSGAATVVILIAPLVSDLVDMSDVYDEWFRSTGVDATDRSSASDLVMPEAFSREWRYHIVPPPGFRESELPESRTDRFGPAELSREFSVSDDGSVDAVLRFDTGGRRFTAAQVAEVRTAFESLEPVVVVEFESVGEAHLLAGEVKEALREFRRLAALHPGEAIHPAQVARALLEGGIGEAARAEVRRAVELEPDSAAAHQTWAWVLQHDLVGRRLTRGADPVRATESYQRALEIDPDDIAIRTDLAILLEHGSDGVRYGPGADLDTAIDHYRLVADELEPGSPIHTNLAIALMWARRFDELKDVATTAPLYLVAVAASDGASSAIREANSGLPDPGTRQATLLAAAQQLMQLRLYDVASGLFRAAARGAAAAPSILALANQLSGTPLYDEAELADSEPESVLKKLFIAAVLGEDLPVDILAEELTSLQDGEAPLSEFRQGLRATATGDMPAVSSTELEITLVVTDTQTAQTHEWFNPLGTPFELLRDLAAFPDVCP